MEWSVSSVLRACRTESLLGDEVHRRRVPARRRDQKRVAAEGEDRTRRELTVSGAHVFAGECTQQAAPQCSCGLGRPCVVVYLVAPPVVKAMDRHPSQARSPSPHRIADVVPHARAPTSHRHLPICSNHARSACRHQYARRLGGVADELERSLVVSLDRLREHCRPDKCVNSLCPTRAQLQHSSETSSYDSARCSANHPGLSGPRPTTCTPLTQCLASRCAFCERMKIRAGVAETVVGT